MADIQEFAERTARNFLESDASHGVSEFERHRRWHLGLSATAVESIARAVFYASMVPDEGRFPAVSLLSYQKNEEFRCDIPIEELPVNEDNISKLAHAVGQDGHLCIACHEGKASLAGIRVSIMDEMRHFGYASFRGGNPLKFRIRGPGHVESSNGGTALVYKSGSITEERLLPISDVMEALAVVVEETLQPESEGTVESIEDLFNDIAKAIVRQGHGGILIVMKEWDDAKFSSRRLSNSPVLHDRLLSYYRTAAGLSSALGLSGNLWAPSENRENSPQFLAVASETAMIEKCINLIANLAGMDGAIVMDNSCDVLAFNAIINRGAAGKAAALVDGSGAVERAEVTNNRGSRHQSALSFAERVPDSFVFVISQDGGVTAFHNRGDGFCRWEAGLRVLD